ncbi:hypothetical protein VQH23_04875 [Pararoseomonas sp. SCSIO 73927]|uniref:hypothetical protein n=1 Tax=Pararoseomonas sp. SCSIO 73927 TaxID=3114537 RepID=UPI0030D193B0
MSNTSSTPSGPLQRALAGDGAALAAIRGRLQDGFDRAAAEGSPAVDDRTALLRGAYAAALDLLPRLKINTERR